MASVSACLNSVASASTPVRETTMALNGAVQEPPIPEHFIDSSLSSHTVKCESRLRGFSRDVLFKAIQDNVAEFTPRDIESIWKTETSGQWYITFKSKEMAIVHWPPSSIWTLCHVV